MLEPVDVPDDKNNHKMLYPSNDHPISTWYGVILEEGLRNASNYVTTTLKRMRDTE